MPADNLDRIPVIIATTMATLQWDIELPVDVPVAALITKLIEAPELTFTEQNSEGEAIPYRLMWREQDRYLGEAETLREAAVQPGHTLVMTHEARAGDVIAIATEAR